MAAHAAVALRAAQQLDDMSRARRTTAALLDIVQATSSDAGATIQVCSSALFEAIVGLQFTAAPPPSAFTQAVIKKVVDAAYVLLNCERVTLYLVDSVKQELWMALAADAAAMGARIPIGQGLAGTVASTGAPLNIPDAYADRRFDRSFDAATGFKTRSVLVWPISLQVCGLPPSSCPASRGAAQSATPPLPPLSRSQSGKETPGNGVIAVLQVCCPVSSARVTLHRHERNYCPPPTPPLQAINKRSSSVARVASARILLRAQAGSSHAGGGAQAKRGAIAGGILTPSDAAAPLEIHAAHPHSPVAASGRSSAVEASDGALGMQCCSICGWRLQSPLPPRCSSWKRTVRKPERRSRPPVVWPRAL